MKLFDMMASFIRSVFESAARLFGPNQDNYPETGVQPYTGDPAEEVISG